MFRNYLRRTGFRRQLTVIISAAILGLALFSSVMNSWEASRRMQSYFVEQGERIAENLARQSTLALLYHSGDNAREGVATTLAFPDVIQVEITNANHKPLVSQAKAGANLSLAQQNIPPMALSRAMMEYQTNDVWRFGAPVYEGQAESSPFEVQERQPQLLGYVHVVIGKGTVTKLTNRLLFNNFAITLFFAALLLWLVRLLTRHMINPLNALSALMRRAEAGESGMRAEPSGPRDLIEMALAFNKMMNVLEEREDELKQSRDKAVNMALMKAQFAATVSHEVRTPLNGVVGMLDMLKEMNLTKRQQECVEVAWSSSRTLIDLINNILDFSKMEAGKLELEEIDFDLRKLMEEVIELIAKQAQQKGLELGYLLQADVPERIKGDSLRLRQILINLIGNAVKFTEKGEVAIRISSTINQDQYYLRFEVSDTGIGMNQDAVQHVFESFAQADPSTTRKYGGTGLGLAICKQLVGLLGGEIGVASQLGKGTTFFFSIRYKPGATGNVPAEDLALKGLRVLVVDESEIVRSFLEQNLTRHHMQCHSVRNGPEAVVELRRSRQDMYPYSLVIMDIGAVDESGIDLARRIHADYPATQLRILILDRYNSPTTINQPGSEATLGKPLRLDRLLDAIKQLISAQDEILVEKKESSPGTNLLSKEFRILVAEDNRTNQMVAAGMLAMNGCQCEFAANGREAMEAARANRFDLILMDCSMPEMDGYEATAHIRNYEESAGYRTPIVAMTANTQRGDAEKCLAAGMDDYLAKPITLVELRQKLELWLPRGVQEERGNTNAERPAVEAPEGTPLDHVIFDKLREILGPSLEQAVKPFLEDTPAYLDQLELAVKENAADKARAAAHAIKGSSGNLGAGQLAQLAKQAEEMALDSQVSDIAALLPHLRVAFDAVARVLNSEVSIEDTLIPDQEEELAQVLVVDDDRSTRSALRHTLQRDGFRVEEACDGAQALLMLKRFQPDVILMDAVMPVMDGFTACAKIQDLPNGRAIPVLMITGLEDNVSVERAFAAGASDYIPKPIHFAVLSQRVRRIIEANRAEKRIRHLAYNDLLTGLPNRTLFFDQLGKSLDQARANSGILAVLFLDLDRFKYVNDNLGHDVGDRLLIAVAHRVRRSVRNVDCVARLGGDEFTVVLDELDGPAAAAAAAQNICRVLSAPFQIDGHDIFVTSSVGIAMYPNDGTDVGTLVKHADTAMYRAKKNNSGFQFFEASMEHSISEHVRLESDLRRALDNEELDVFYQPQARLDTGEIIGMEALVRWHHPIRGVVSPVEFIPLAEETGLIKPLGDWVLRTACTQLKRWMDMPDMPRLRVAVNLSVKQLLQKDFASTVESVLLKTGLPADLLELEITESTLMENAHDTLEALHNLRNLGLRLSIDDFGTGYSSLSYLKRFPVDIIKIDRSFVRDTPNDADDAAIVTGIIALAHSLRLEVVAEGVESEAQLHFLRDQACDILQGYYLSKPIPADKFEQFILSKAYLQLEGFANADREAVAAL